jgi:hypothetical protein
MMLNSDGRLRCSAIVDVTRVSLENDPDPSIFTCDLKPEYLVQRSSGLYRVGADSQTLNSLGKVETNESRMDRPDLGTVAGAVAIAIVVMGFLGRSIVRKRTRDRARKDVATLRGA